MARFGLQLRSTIDESVLVDEFYDTWRYHGRWTPVLYSREVTDYTSTNPYTHYVDVSGAGSRVLAYLEPPAWNGSFDYRTANGAALTGIFPAGAGQWRIGVVVAENSTPGLVHVFARSSDFSLPNPAGPGLAVWNAAGLPIFYSGWVPHWLAANTNATLSPGANGSGLFLQQDAVSLPWGTPAIALMARSPVWAIYYPISYMWALHKVYSWKADSRQLICAWATTQRNSATSTPVDIIYNIYQGGYDTVTVACPMIDTEFFKWIA